MTIDVTSVYDETTSPCEADGLKSQRLANRSAFQVNTLGRKFQRYSKTLAQITRWALVLAIWKGRPRKFPQKREPDFGDFRAKVRTFS